MCSPVPNDPHTGIGWWPRVWGTQKQALGDHLILSLCKYLFSNLPRSRSMLILNQPTGLTIISQTSNSQGQTKKVKVSSRLKMPCCCLSWGKTEMIILVCDDKTQTKISTSYNKGIHCDQWNCTAMHACLSLVLCSAFGGMSLCAGARGSGPAPVRY